MINTGHFDVDVLVVGAGPTGLALARDLRRRGIDCGVVERSPAFSTSSRGKGVQPRTLEVVDDLDAVRSLLSTGWSRNIPVHWHVAGKLSADLKVPGRDPRPDVPYPTLVLVPQWRTERALGDRLSALGGRVALGCELEDLSQDGTGVTARVREAVTGQARAIRSRYLVGCDGGHSRVRKALGLALAGNTHAEHFVFGDVEIDGLDPDGAYVWFDGPRYLAASPFPGQWAWQVQASVHPDAQGRLEPASLELFDRLFRDRAGRSDVRLTNPTWLSNFVANVRMVDRYRVGRVFLAGDAAHVHSPAGGQGMNIGIQDAYNLGWKLDLVLRGRAAGSLLDTYEEERLPIARAVLGGTDIGYAAVFSPNPSITIVRERVLVPLLRLPRVQQAILGTTRQLDVNYRRSSLVRRTTRPHRSARRAPTPAARLLALLRFVTGPRAGDRAPDAQLEGVSQSRTRLFDQFRGPHFTLLIFDAGARTPADYHRLTALAHRAELRFGPDVRARAVVPGSERSGRVGTDWVLLDPHLRAHRCYGVAAAALYLVRPDGYGAMRAPDLDEGEVTSYLNTILQSADVIRGAAVHHAAADANPPLPPPFGGDGARLTTKGGLFDLHGSHLRVGLRHPRNIEVLDPAGFQVSGFGMINEHLIRDLATFTSSWRSPGRCHGPALVAPPRVVVRERPKRPAPAEPPGRRRPSRTSLAGLVSVAPGEVRTTTTTVRRHNALGRGYFAKVARVHCGIMPTCSPEQRGGLPSSAAKAAGVGALLPRGPGPRGRQTFDAWLAPLDPASARRSREGGGRIPPLIERATAEGVSRLRGGSR